MNDISVGNNNNPENMEKYYEIAKLLNEEKNETLENNQINCKRKPRKKT